MHLVSSIPFVYQFVGVPEKHWVAVVAAAAFTRALHYVSVSPVSIGPAIRTLTVFALVVFERPVLTHAPESTTLAIPTSRPVLTPRSVARRVRAQPPVGARRCSSSSSSTVLLVLLQQEPERPGSLRTVFKHALVEGVAFHHAPLRLRYRSQSC